MKLPIIARCPGCCEKTVLLSRRLNTAYVNDELNWSGWICDNCFQETIDYYADLWAQYYSERL